MTRLSKAQWRALEQIAAGDGCACGPGGLVRMPTAQALYRAGLVELPQRKLGRFVMTVMARVTATGLAQINEHRAQGGLTPIAERDSSL